MQACSKCHVEKPLEDFYQRKNGAYRKDCKSCFTQKTKEWKEKNADKMREYWRLYCLEAYRKNPEKGKEKARRYRAANPDRVKITWADNNKKRWANITPEKKEQEKKRLRIFYEKNREKQLARTSAAKKRNRGHYTAYQNARRALQLSASPPWLSAIQLNQIAEMYDVAVACNMQTGIKHHVDHIVPLRGKAVRGLHVPWNLQVIPAIQNHRKHNKLVEEYLR